MPKLVLAELVILLLGVLYQFVPMRPHRRSWFVTWFGQGWDLPVPTPPPRFLVAAA